MPLASDIPDEDGGRGGREKPAAGGSAARTKDCTQQRQHPRAAKQDGQEQPGEHWVFMSQNVERAQGESWRQIAGEVKQVVDGRPFVMCAQEAFFPTSESLRDAEMVARTHMPGCSLLGAIGHRRRGVAFLVPKVVASSIIPFSDHMINTDGEHWAHI